MANHHLSKADTYALPRDTPETKRLNEQHAHMIHSFGFLVHPSIPTDQPDLRIADIACGSGIWPQEVAAQFPTSRCDGFDISAGQFPSKDKLSTTGQAERVKFHVANAADPTGPGKEFEGVFDIVAIRLMHINLLGKQWDLAVRNVVSMLKPGGYVQWQDWDPRTADVISTQALAPRRGLDGIVAGFRAFLATRDTGATNRLPQMLEDIGIVDISSELFSMVVDDWSKTYNTNNMAGAAPMVIRKALLGVEGNGWDEEKLANVVEEAARDVKAGKAYMRNEVWCHVGRKKGRLD